MARLWNPPATARVAITPADVAGDDAAATLIVLDAPRVGMRHTVKLQDLTRGTVVIATKVAAVHVDSCSGVVLECAAGVVGSVEVFNCRMVRVTCARTCPTFAVDGCEDVTLRLSDADVAAATQLVHSNCAALSVEVPAGVGGGDAAAAPPAKFTRHAVDAPRVLRQHRTVIAVDERTGGTVLSTVPWSLEYGR